MTACTEKEAAEKWCPHMRNSCAQTTCLGSRCMQWRWVDDDKWVGGEMTRRGYCGLAGKP